MAAPATVADSEASPDERARLAVLAALREHDDLARDYALKGGYVLHRVYGSPRPSFDLDLDHVDRHSLDPDGPNRATLEDVCRRLNATLPVVAGRFGLDDAGLRVVRWSDRLATAFAEARYRSADGSGGAVEVQVTLCERIPQTALARVDGVPVLIATLDVLVADKLKVLLQQTGRHDVRYADVYDLWFALVEAPFVPDPAAVREALLTAAETWPSLQPVTAASYAGPAVRAFAEQGYRALRAEEPDLPFAPFDVVWAEILAFVGALGLPEGEAP